MSKQATTIQALASQLTRLTAAADAMREAQRKYEASPTTLYALNKKQAEKDFDLALRMCRTTPAAPPAKRPQFSKIELFEGR